MAEQARRIIAGRYAVQELIQAGGMASVYRARDLHTDELVALKSFDTDRHLPEISREGFWREVESLKNLSHPHIVRLRDSGVDDVGRFFVVLDLMKHDLVAEREKGGQAFQGWDDFAELVALPLLDALCYAHQSGIAHRDVKPANLLISDDGTVRLADFSISKLKRTLQPRITLSEFMSPPFAPPERDTGSFTYARDTYAVGALCIWAMCELPLNSCEDVQRALDETEFGPIREVRDIIERAISTDPAKRYENAVLLAADLGRVQAARRQRWLVHERPRCSVGITNTARDNLMRELELERESEVIEFVSSDLNAEAVVARYIENFGQLNERVRPNHYFVFGGGFKYHLAVNDRGVATFAILNAYRCDPDFLQRRREEHLLSPLVFSVDARSGCLPSKAAVDRLDAAIQEFDQRRIDEQRRAAQTALFDTWIRVLQAKVQYEKDQTKPIAFTAAEIDGPFITLSVTGDLSKLELEQDWVIETDDARRIRGEVWEIGPTSIVLNCAQAALHDVPESGVARLDLYALRVAVDRQRAAIDSIRSGTCANAGLRDVLLKPFDAEPPATEGQLGAKADALVDVSQRRAVCKCVNSEDIVLIEGPPGTGKTQFIVALILETLARNPEARILLASQTHIAIDNALERLGREWSGAGLLRIAREGGTKAAASSEPYLLAPQMARWREEVIARGTEALKTWAERQGLDPSALRVASLVRQLAASDGRVVDLRTKINEEEERKSGLAKLRQSLSAEEFEVESDRVAADLEDLRDQLDAEKKHGANLEAEFATRQKDAAKIMELTGADRLKWADEQIRAMPHAERAERLMRLQSEWFDRFGSAKGLLAPLIERASVVAATCIGLAALEEANTSQFDLCIIDEASKATAMEACVPMARARRWVLVGDSKQLPPFHEEFLTNPDLREFYEVAEAEATESAFERLRRLLPEANREMLTTQYRMVEPIGRLVSECFYEGKLVNTRKEIDKSLASLTGKTVNWMSTRKLARRQDQKAGRTSYVNPEEAAKICDLLLDLDDALHRGTPGKPRSVLVLSGYGEQVRYLERSITQVRRELRHLVPECCTIDRVQGRQADVVFFSVTRSNPDNKAGFLRELERVNVALSRARDLLVIVGDDEFVQRAGGADSLRRVLGHIRSWPSECFMAVFDDPA